MRDGYMTLLGAEDVSRAASTISSAASEMSRAASTIDSAAETFRRTTQELVDELRALREEMEQARLPRKFISTDGGKSFDETT